ncbi:hypothetical protein F4818DRAFT_455289 [Hypoxylon cercidicola]|nr:hypothetical protein F4818DRAFT_455289 [Hypoxylon cercidicola]
MASIDGHEDGYEVSTHYIESISSGCGDRITLSIRWNNARLVVDLDPSPEGNSAEDSLIEKYNAAIDTGDPEEEDAMTDQILDAIVEVGRPLFDRLAPRPVPGIPVPSDLHSLLFPAEHAFFFRTVDNKMKLIPNDELQDTAPHAAIYGESPELQLQVHQDINLPRFSTKDIHVLRKLLGDGYITQVLAGGQEMCSKRELSCLWKITASQHADVLRVPKLLGLVHAPDSERIIGFLQTYIPCADEWELSTLRDIETVSSIAKTRREKWASQVQETVHLLHQIGVTRGDAKASNVLIDCNTDDAWVVDFGGGWTEGCWVDQESSGTIEGDEIALRKIFEFLEIY